MYERKKSKGTDHTLSTSGARPGELAGRCFYKLDEQGLAPKTHNVGVKRLISPEADAEWLRAREAEAA